jgi:hypothetical protein
MNSVYEVTMKLRALQQSVINNLAPNRRRERERERDLEFLHQAVGKHDVHLLR